NKNPRTKQGDIVLKRKAAAIGHKQIPWRVQNHTTLHPLSFTDASVSGIAKTTNKCCSTFEAELADAIPVVKTSIAGTRIIGRLCAGNKNGHLVPHTTTDQELQHLRNILPDQVVVLRTEGKLSALGNCIACNDDTMTLTGSSKLSRTNSSGVAGIPFQALKVNHRKPRRCSRG
ncbi:PREDICTED: eukaryotic translation initiation factor 6-2-like, partial [Populus euphratica]|uniref:Eukaryotic translation initiation factor 6-2-like n=1 Tax=Populus euphratica TaxID=75702 RepID=A0AAJ6UN08_POPEU